VTTFPSALARRKQGLSFRARKRALRLPATLHDFDETRYKYKDLTMAEGSQPCTEIEMPNSQLETSKKSSIFLKDHGGVFTNIQNAANVQVNGRMTVYMNDGCYTKRKFKPTKPVSNSTATITTDQILDIKDRLGRDWKDLGRRLGFDDAELLHKRVEHRDDPGELNYQILCGWRQRNADGATQANLAKIFVSMFRGDLADLLA
jgi:hypothetical protein